jgi:hypothetical protein
MTVKEIMSMLSELPEDAVLSHVWTTPMGEPTKEAQDMRTKLYFKKGKLRTEISLEHIKSLIKRERRQKKPFKTSMQGAFEKANLQ